MITINDLSDYNLIKGKNETIDKGYPMVEKALANGKAMYNKNDNIKRITDTWIEKANKILAEISPKGTDTATTPVKKPKTDDSKTTKTDKPEKGSKSGKGGKGGKKGETTKTEETKKGSKGGKSGKSGKGGKGSKKGETTKTDEPKTTKAPKAKEGKPKVGEPEPWQVTLRYFATYCCGKEKTVTSIRKFVKQIQYQFTADLKNKTPHIELIREIQKKLCPYTDPKNKNVQLPEWADLKEKCRKAALDKIVSSKVEKPKIKEIALSGLKKKRKSSKRRKSSCR